MFEVCKGMNTTFPFGARTPLLNLFAVASIPATTIDEKNPVAGLYIPMFDAFWGTKRTRPSGKRTDPP
jgi:hypothetical protein